MYVYFDVNGNLKEIVNLPVREGSVKANTIYIYIEPVNNPQPVNNIFSLPQRFTNAKINFKDDGGNNINPNGGNSVPMVKLTGDNAVQIPTDPKKDIYFFKYGFKYEMWSVELPSTVTSVNGLVSATAYLYNSTAQLALNTFSFNVEASVGVKPDRTMSEAQYSYLYNKISSIQEGDFVPYTGADKPVNIGNNYLKGGMFITLNEGTEYKEGYITNTPLPNGDTVNFLFPHKRGDVEYEWLATQGWVKSTSIQRNDDGYWVADTDGSSGIVFEDDGYAILTLEEDGIRVTNWGENETLVEFPTKSGGGTEQVAYRSQLPSKNVIGTFNTSGFAVPSGQDYYKIDNISLSGQLGDLFVITWGNSFALCPVPSEFDAKGDNLVDAQYGDDQMEEGQNITGTYDLLGDWRENELWPTASAYVYLYGNSTYSVQITNGSITIMGTHESGGQVYTTVSLTFRLSDLAENLCPGWNGTFDIEDVEVYKRIKKREGHVVGSLIGNDGYAKVVRVKYEIVDDTTMSITTDSSFTPPANYTGYVINYKII